MERFCVNCGSPLVNRGRAAKQCGECERGRRRVKSRSAICIDCQTTFTPPGQTGQLPLRCGPCNDAHMRSTGSFRQKQWRDANPERNKEQQNKSNRKRLADPAHRQAKRDNELRRTYGLTRIQLNEMIAAQNELCAICGNVHVGPGVRLHVDHNHETGKVRALLCAKCNTLIGLADDDPERLELAAAYLRRHM